MAVVGRVWRWLKLTSFLRPGSNLLHSMIVDGRTELLKKVLLLLRRGMFSAFLVGYNVRLKGIKLKRY